MKRVIGAMVFGLVGFAGVASAAPLYLPGVSAACGTCTFGTMLGATANAPGLPPAGTGSVGGAGGGPSIGPTGSALDGDRVYIWDQAGWNNADNSVTRGDNDFAMMVWDLGVGNALDTVRLYTHQDHITEGYGDFVAQDLMEYSVWGSNDNLTFALLSDVVAMVPGANVNSPTYTFFGTEPTVIYRGGSTEFGLLNAYTRDYTFAQAYRYYGVRSSSVSLDYCGARTQGVPQVGCVDADPELDALAFNRGPIQTPVPEPASLTLLGAGLVSLAARARRRRK